MRRVWDKTDGWHAGDARLTNATLVALGLALVVLAHQFTREIDHFVIGFDQTSLISVVVYLAAVLVVRTQPVNRATMGIIVPFSVAMFAVTYLTKPYLSSDIYRYVWDGMVQHHFINPYRYVPGNPALTSLRAPNQEIFDNINRRDYAPTIYPPVAQMMYWLATYFAPSVAAMKLLMLGFLALTAWVLALLLKQLGRSTSDLLILLWCPLLVWEIGCAGHVDAAVCGLISLALLFRLRRQPALCGLFLGMAVMTKFYPLLLLPALYQRRDWKMPAAVAGVCVAGYALYSSVGWRVLGFMQGYTKEEGIDSGSRFFLLNYVHSLPGLAEIPNTAFTAFSAAVLACLVFWAWRYGTGDAPLDASVVGHRRTDSLPVPAFAKAAAMLAFALMLLFSPHYAWYNVWLIPFTVLLPCLPLLCYTMAFFYGYTTALAAMPGPQMFLLNERIYLATGAALLLHFLLKRWPVWSFLVTDRRAAQDRECVASVRERASPMRERTSVVRERPSLVREDASAGIR